MGEHDEKCVRCGVVGEDRRTLWMACFYAMEELGLPLKEVSFWVERMEVGPRRGPREVSNPQKPNIHHLYTLRVCNDCRSDWMHAIQEWFKTTLVDEPTGTGVYIRDMGRTREASPSEVEEMRRPND